MRVVRIEDDAERIAELRAERRDDHAVTDSRVPTVDDTTLRFGSYE